MLAEIRVTPVGIEVDFARTVAGVARVMSDTSLRYEMHAQGTTVEGDLDEILEAVRRCAESVRTQCRRALIELSIDDRGPTRWPNRGWPATAGRDR